MNAWDYEGDTASIEAAFPELTEYGVTLLWEGELRRGEPCRMLAYETGSYSAGTGCYEKFRGVELEPVDNDHASWQVFDAVQQALEGSRDRLTSAEIRYAQDGSIAFGEFGLDECPLFVYAPGYVSSPGTGDLPYDSVRIDDLSGDWFAVMSNGSVFPC